MFDWGILIRHSILKLILDWLQSVFNYVQITSVFLPSVQSSLEVQFSVVLNISSMNEDVRV